MSTLRVSFEASFQTLISNSVGSLGNNVNFVSAADGDDEVNGDGAE